MTDTLFTPPPADGRLTPRQTLVLTLAQHQPAGITATDAGTALHADTCRWCRDGQPCKYAASAGLEVLRALKKKALVKQRRGGIWQATRPIDNGPDPSTDPFPEGF